MKKGCFTILICCFLAYSSSGQSNQALYKAEIQSASVDLQDQQYRSAINHAEKAKTYLGQDSTTAQIEYINTKSYVGLMYFDDARSSLKNYFSVAKEEDFGYNEMLVLLSRIDDLEGDIQKEEEMKKAEAQEDMEAWTLAAKINTAESYQSFLTKHPHSAHAADANKLINNLKTQSLLVTEKALAASYKIKWQNRRSARGWLLGLGLASAYGGAHLIVNTYAFDVGVVIYLAGLTSIGSSFIFVHPRKYKKRYKKQLIKIEDLEKSLSSTQTLYRSNWQIGISPQNAGLSLVYKF